LLLLFCCCFQFIVSNIKYRKKKKDKNLKLRKKRSTKRSKRVLSDSVKLVRRQPDFPRERFCHVISRLWRMLHRWKVLSFLCFLPYVVQGSLLYNKVLTAQVLYTAIFVSLVFKCRHSCNCCLSNSLAGLTVVGEVFGHNGSLISELLVDI